MECLAATAVCPRIRPPQKRSIAQESAFLFSFVDFLLSFSFRALLEKHEFEIGITALSEHPSVLILPNYTDIDDAYSISNFGLYLIRENELLEKEKASRN